MLQGFDEMALAGDRSIRAATAMMVADSRRKAMRCFLRVVFVLILCPLFQCLG